eukprot:ANDGO_02046.mRNA.1 UPF0192 protein TM_0984
MPFLGATQFFSGQRYLSYVSTDRPFYKPGETIRARSLFLDAFSHKPCLNAASSVGFEHDKVKWIVKGPSGAEVFSVRSTESMKSAENSTAAFEWKIPEDAAGGVHALWVHPNTNGVAVGVRHFEVRSTFVPPQLFVTTTFVKKGYVAGDTVQAAVSVKRKSGDAPARLRVSLNIWVDGKSIQAQELDVEGNSFVVTAPLPTDLSSDNALLTLQIWDEQGVMQSSSKSIPILLKNILFSVVAESGSLVASLESHVYFEAKSLALEPLDVTVGVFSQGNQLLGEFSSVHEGRGKGLIRVPAGITQVLVKVTGPQHIDASAVLPVLASGFCILHKDAQTNAIAVTTNEASSTDYEVKVMQKEKILHTVVLAASTTEVKLDSIAEDGVLQIAVFKKGDADRAIAERLVYKKPALWAEVSAAPSVSQAAPGDAARIRLKSSVADKAADTIFFVTVVDDAVLQSIEERRRPVRLPGQVFFENEVEDELFDGNAYASDVNKADLLVGVQAWKRFLFVHDPLAKLQEDADKWSRFLAAWFKEPPPPPPPVMMMRNFGMRGGMQMAAAPMAFNMMAMPCAAPVPCPPPGVALFDADADDDDDDAAMEGAADLLFDRVEMAENDAEPMMEKRAEMPVGGTKEDRPARREEEEEAPKEAMAPMRQKRLLNEAFLRPRPVEPAGVSVRMAREFSFTKRPNWTPALRQDFAQCVYWSAAVRGKEGSAEISFDLSDSITSYRVIVDAVTGEGHVGFSDQMTINVDKPFSVQVKAPERLMDGDRVQVDVTIRNSLAEDLHTQLERSADGVGLKLVSEQMPGADLKILAHGTSFSRVPVSAKAGKVPQNGHVLVQGTASFSGNSLADAEKRSVVVEPKGFPVSYSLSGTMSSQESVEFECEGPASGQYLENTMFGSLRIPTSAASSLTDAVQGLIREPYGCFEQTSTVMYPMIMALSYLKSHPEVAEKSSKLFSDALQHISAGYKKLVGYESPSGGFEWFGGDPGHEALTAYGLMEFIDLSKVWDGVDMKMVSRTFDWLMKRRNGKGAFERNSRSLDNFGAAPEYTTHAYIMWSLGHLLKVKSEASSVMSIQSADFQIELQELRKHWSNSDDSYFVALSGLIYLQYLPSDTESIRKFSDLLVSRQSKDSGAIEGGRATITSSRGESLQIETSALAALLWINMVKEKVSTTVHEPLNNVIKFLYSSNDHGSFSSTQGTLLSLKAIVEYETLAKLRIPEPVSFVLSVDGDSTLMNPIILSAETFEEMKGKSLTLELPQAVLQRLASPGAHRVAIRPSGAVNPDTKLSVPVSIDIDYRAAVARISTTECPVSLNVAMSHNAVEVGKSVAVSVEIGNRNASEGQPMTIAIIGIPFGSSHDSTSCVS